MRDLLPPPRGPSRRLSASLLSLLLFQASCPPAAPPPAEVPLPAAVPPPSPPRPDPTDQDGDGDRSMAAGGRDCDDGNPLVHSRASEACDGLDNNCDGHVDGGPGTLCLALSVQGEHPGGELGFRFGSPRDLDGDGIADVVAGARFADFELDDMGWVGVWSGRDGRRFASWEGKGGGGLFGHTVLAGPDIDGDGIADVIAAAPLMAYGPIHRGTIAAYSARSEHHLWHHLGEPNETTGWDLALAGDQDGDGVEDLFVGSPGANRVYALSGATGRVIRRYDAPEPQGNFGWYVARIDDVDGDGISDLIVGAPGWQEPHRGDPGAAFLYSGGSGRLLRRFLGMRPGVLFGEVVAGLPDLDGDGAPELIVSATEPRDGAGRAFVYSARSGRELFRLGGQHQGELYGRMLTAIDDLDGDGVGDIAVAAPLAPVGEHERAGRIEIRSGRSGRSITTLLGDAPDLWLGWHMRAASDMLPSKTRGLLVSAIMQRGRNGVQVGALRFYAAGR
ncbi:MAG: FG-GAP-like repeat-containing protein [Myxococcales bacterium]|nr:FG-GAP-like repeat-containing protein [Myxococcota bacterium]MDW8284346.1 FG-GAP-like repeat-containing protein [Myxococcales bacterium]